MPKTAKKAAKEHIASCVSCGQLINDEQRLLVDGRNYCTSCAIIARKPEPALRVPSGIVKWICYLASFFSPLTGFVIGLIFSSQKDPDSRNFGRHCIIVMSISLALLVLFVVLSIAASLAALGGGGSGLNLGEGYY